MKSLMPPFLFTWFAAVCFLQNVCIGDELQRGRVSKNVDGDTIWAETDEGRLKIRFHDIDAPESHLVAPGGVASQGQWGTSASNFMENLIPIGTSVDVRSEGLDTYKRTLGHVLLKGSDVGLEMIKAGWAIPYVICTGPTCTQDNLEREKISELFKACETARSQKIGIFDEENPLEEMPFEFRLRVQKRQPDKYVGDFKTKEFFSPKQYQKVDLCRRIFFMKIKDARQLGYHPS